MQNRSGSLAPRHHFCRRPTIHVGLIEYDVRSHVCWPRGQHLLLAHDQIGRVKGRQFKAVTVRDGISRTGLHTVSAENTAVVVDVVDLGVALSAADAIFSGVLGSLDINAVGWAIGRTQEAGNAFFQAIFVALQHMRAAVTCLNPGSPQGAFAIRIIVHDRRLEHLREGDAHALGDRRDIFQH
jgi:hypothetical protein